MSPRSRRLLSDLRQLEELAARGDVAFHGEGDPPDVYHVMLSCRGLAREGDARLVVRDVHRCHVYLHLDYPRRPPVVSWLTPIFHPNILGPDRNGGVCLGGWSAAESLADLCERLLEMVSYRSFNANDALNLEAAHWAVENSVKPGDDVQALTRLGLEDALLVTPVSGTR